MLQISKKDLIHKVTIQKMASENKVFPTSTYFNDLDLYRSTSNENLKTASHLVNLPEWKYFENIVDIGCGDGRMLLELFKLYDKEKKINEVLLVDLDENRIERTKIFFSDFFRAKKITSQRANVIECLPECFNNMDVALLIHVVYYLSKEELIELIEKMPAGIPLFVVLDKEDSIFSSLWKHTAPNYLERADFANQYFDSLIQKRGFQVSKTTISSEIESPYTFPETEKETLLSFICYNDHKMLDNELQERIKSIFNDYTIKNKVSVETNCFSILKTQ